MNTLYALFWSSDYSLSSLFLVHASGRVETLLFHPDDKYKPDGNREWNEALDNWSPDKQFTHTNKEKAIASLRYQNFGPRVLMCIGSFGR